MKIKESKFIISAVKKEQYPELDMPEIAFAGRSNVGKSSMINMLINRKNLARTSSTPGKTQTVNFYDIDELFRFVDLPGYGYARVSKEQHKNWEKIIQTYLNTRETCWKSSCWLIFVISRRCKINRCLSGLSMPGSTASLSQLKQINSARVKSRSRSS